MFFDSLLLLQIVLESSKLHCFQVLFICVIGHCDDMFVYYVQNVWYLSMCERFQVSTPMQRSNSKHIQKTHDGPSKTENRGVIFNFQLAGRAIKMAPAKPKPDRQLEMCSLRRASRRQSFRWIFSGGAAYPERFSFSHHPSCSRSVSQLSLSLRFIVVIMKRDKDINNTAVSVRVPHVVVTLLFVYASRRDVLT